MQYNISIIAMFNSSPSHEDPNPVLRVTFKYT